MNDYLKAVIIRTINMNDVVARRNWGYTDYFVKNNENTLLMQFTEGYELGRYVLSVANYSFETQISKTERHPKILQPVQKLKRDLLDILSILKKREEALRDTKAREKVANIQSAKENMNVMEQNMLNLLTGSKQKVI